MRAVAVLALASIGAFAALGAADVRTFKSAMGEFHLRSRTGEDGCVVLEMTMPLVWGNGGGWQVDGTRGKFPFLLDERNPRLYNRAGRRVAFTDPSGRRLGLEFPEGTRVLIQDNRAWSWAVYCLQAYLPAGKGAESVRFVSDDRPRKAAYVLDRFGQVSRTFPGKVSSEGELKRDIETEGAYYASLDFSGKLARKGLKLNRYGGVAGSGAALGLGKTGFFHVESKDGRWHLVDPLGDDFFHLGICSFGGGDDYTCIEGRPEAFADVPPPGGEYDTAWLGRTNDWWHTRAFSHYRANLIRKFGSCDRHVTNLRNIDRVRQMGFNSMGAFTSAREAAHAKDFPYVGGVPLKGVKATPTIRGLFDPFDPQSVAAVARNCRALKAEADDPLLIGRYLGNEEAFEDVARAVPAMDGTWAAKREFVKFLRGRYADIAALNRAWATDAADFAAAERQPIPVTTAAAFADAGAFAERFIDEYYGLIERNVRANDPNHMLIGSRWQMRTANDEATCRIAGRHLDVISLNYYTWGIDEKLVRRIYEWSGRKPQFWSEFFFSAASEANPGPFSRDLATQRARGLAYRNYVEGAAALGFVVGTEWFSLIDQSATGRFFQGLNGESFNNGILSVTDRPYRDLIDGMLAAHLAVYPVRRGVVEPYRFDDPRFTGEGRSTRLYAAGRTVAKGAADGAQDEYPLRPAELIPASRMVAGGERSTVEADFKSAWDDENLYVHVNVKDETPMCNLHKGRRIWEGDVVEVFLGSEAVGEEGPLRFSDRQFEFSAAPGGETYVPRLAKQPKIPTHVSRTTGGYQLETAIPWTAIGHRPKAGDTLMFDVGVGEGGPDGKRRTHLLWNGTEENCGDRTDWGRLVLQP